MSTILKALKKLEQEKESLRPAGPTPVISRSPSTLGGLAGWFLTPWVRRGTLGFIIIALSVAAFHFYSQSRSHSPKMTGQTAVMEKNTQSAKAAPNNPRPSTIAPVAKKETAPVRPENSRPPQKGTADLPPLVAQANPRATGVNPDHPRPNLPSISKAAEPPVQERPIPKPNPIIGSARHPDAASRRSGPANPPVAEMPELIKEAGQTGTAPAKSSLTASHPLETKTSSDVFENAPALTDGRLKVHAIAWSPTVEDRMAVVNNRVIYEGDSVDNFVVVAIRPDDVVVREKEKGLWRVVFGRP